MCKSNFPLKCSKKRVRPLQTASALSPGNTASHLTSVLQPSMCPALARDHRPLGSTPCQPHPRPQMPFSLPGFKPLPYPLPQLPFPPGQRTSFSLQQHPCDLVWPLRPQCHLCLPLFCGSCRLKALANYGRSSDCLSGVTPQGPCSSSSFHLQSSPPSTCGN